jgi:hypothetical protein
MATLRNLVISLLRLGGVRYIPTGLRACAWNAAKALRLIGVALA